MNRIFPIKSDPACLLKWCWSTIFFNSGTSASCHRTKKYAIDPENFFQFHNLPEKIRDRQMMLQGVYKKTTESTTNIAAIERFKQHLDLLDSRRDTDWRQTFPWLDQDFVL